jgi:hypothetical protein
VTEPDDVLKKLSDLIEGLENLNVQQQVVEPRKQKQLAAMLEDARTAMAELRARQRELAPVSELIDALDQNNAGLIEAINKSSTVTHDVLSRLEMELVSKNGRAAFDAPKAVLDEGEYLKAQLAVGRMGTESAGAGFDDAPRPDDPSGLEVLAGSLATRKTSRKSP